VLTLAALNMADEFDRIAFSALSPEIRDAFDLSDSSILMLNVVPGIMILLTAGLIGRLADKHNRILVSLGAAAAWGLATVGTGLAPSLAALVVVRILSGVGRAANEIVHPSLIADLYPEPVHPRAYLLHRWGNPIAQVSGILAGWIGGRYGWAWAFYLLAIPTVLLTVALARLKDPGPNAGAADISMLAAVKQLAKIRSFPRLWVAAIFLGAASFGIFGLASLYFEDEFGLGPRGRGAVQAIIGFGWFIGVFVGGQFATRFSVSGDYRRLVGICAASFGSVAIAGVALAAAPVVGVAYLLIFVLAFGNGVWQSPFFSSVAKIAPPVLSGQAFGSSATAYAVGSFLTLPIALVSDQTKRGAFLLVALFGALAGYAAYTVTKVVDEDLRIAAAPAQ
jgi:MFS family permease